MNTRLSDALENCLQRMQQGETLESVLAHYPGLETDLRPLLEAAVLARSTSRESLPTGVLARQRSRGLALAADLRQGKNPLLVLGRFWRSVIMVLAVVVVLVISTNNLLNASARSLPGDTLYPLKRSVESTQLRLVSDPVKKLELEHTFSQRRVDETKSLISEDRVEDVEFTGVVLSQSDGEWLISGITVVVTSQTEIEKGINVGDEIEVNGSTNSAGDVVAISLRLAQDYESDGTLPGDSPTQPAFPEDGHPEDSFTPTFLPEEDHPEVSPTQPASPEDDHPESTPTQISSPENDHSENSQTPTPSPEGDHPESSSTRSPTPDGSD
jgi:hypothetical protein